MNFLKQYSVSCDDTTIVEVPQEATHYKFKKGRINFYMAENIENNGFHDVPDDKKNAKIISRSHGNRYIERSIEWC